MQTQPAEMTTVTAVLEKLRQRHLDNEFVMDEKGFTPGNGKYYNPEDLTILRTYRFEGASDPGDSSIIYIIQTHDGLTGYSMDAYGVYSDHEGLDYDDFIKRIPVDERDEQALFS